MKTRHYLGSKKTFSRWMSAAAILASSAFAASASAATPPAFSGSFNRMYTTSTTDGSGNTTYSLDFHMTGSGLPIQLTNLPSGLSSAVTEDLMVTYGSSGIANGSGGPVTLSELIINDGSNQATYDISGAVMTQYGNPSDNSTWVGSITGGTATLNTNPTKTTPTFASYLSSIPVAKFTLSYVGAYDASSSSPPLLAPSGSISYNAVAAVPEPATFATASIGAAILGGYLWRRRRSVLKTGVGQLAALPC